ncbi:MAG: hypothetical protein L3K09_03185 [Thermoplasmata archaeon]|nr:hypothetical protein [Thermoplasmata archaeon]
MQPSVSFVRSPSDRAIPRDLFVPETRPFHRPVQRTRLRIDTPERAEKAHRAGLPVYLLRPETVIMLGYPINFPPVLFSVEPTLSGVDTQFRKLPSTSVDAIRDPRIEDVIVMLLQLDELAARAVAERNRAELRPAYLLKRVLQENLERAATLVRLQDFAPAIEAVGDALPKATLERQMRKNSPKQVIP